MEVVNQAFIRSNLYRLPKDSHKGQNGRLTIVGGSKLFHGASLWALKVASRMVDMVYYASVSENLELIKDLKKELYDFIAVPRGKETDYIAESDAVLLGPGLVRGKAEDTGTGESGAETRELVLTLLSQFPQKKWVLDAGALQVITPEELMELREVIITPHAKEFESLFKFKDQKSKIKATAQNLKLFEEKIALVKEKAEQFRTVVVLKGREDVICAPDGRCLISETGNEGMTKGGTGDVLAGLIAALACKNDLFVAGAVGAYINGLAGDELYQKAGPYFNASDLCDRVPKTLAKIMGYPEAS